MTTTYATQDHLAVDNLRIAYYLAHKHLWTGMELDDLASIARIGLVIAARGYDPALGYAFTTFAHRCAGNEIVKEHRQQKRCPETISLNGIVQTTSGNENIELMDVLPADGPPVEAGLEREDDLRLMRAALRSLPERDREIVAMRFGLGGEEPMALREIGQMLGVSTQRVSARVQRAIGKMRKMIKKMEEETT